MSLQARPQHRIQQHGWERASAAYQFLWQSQLSKAHQRLLALAEPGWAERVLDVGCGTGLIALAAADKVGPSGRVAGLDSSPERLQAAQAHALALALTNVRFQRTEDGPLPCSDSSIDLLYCALGLPSMAEPLQALRDMHRVIRPGGRIALMVWGERAHCAWSSAYSLFQVEMGGEREPAALGYGAAGALAGLCREAGFTELREERLDTLVHYDNEHDACQAAFAELGPQWPGLHPRMRARIESRYAKAIAPWRTRLGYRMPVQFVLLVGCKPAHVF